MKDIDCNIRSEEAITIFIQEEFDLVISKQNSEENKNMPE